MTPERPSAAGQLATTPLCSDYHRLLAADLDGERSPAEGTALLLHLNDCSLCREEQHADGELRQRLKGLTREIEPERDLWSGITWRMTGDPSPHRTHGWHSGLVGLAAAASLVLLLAGLLASDRAGRAPSPEAKPLLAEFVAAEQEYRRAADHLAAILASRGSELPTATRTVLTENLAILDRAIAETRAELEREPQESRLAMLLGDMYMQKGQLLRHAATDSTQ